LEQVIVEKDPKSQIQDIDKRKFLVPNDITVAQFMWIIRRRIQLPSEKAIFLFVGKVLPQSRYEGLIKAIFYFKTKST
jgi:GABA(A) receptor-associated protein